MACNHATAYCIANDTMYVLVMATGLSRPGKSREGPGTGREGTGQDLETLKVPWSCGPGTKKVQKSRDLKIEKVPGQWKPY